MKTLTWTLAGLALMLCGCQGRFCYQANFEQDVMADWVVETQDGTVTIEDGVMDINVPVGCTVWFKPKLQAPVRISYTVTVVDEGGLNDRVSDLNCFWMAIDPCHPDDLFVRSRQRGGTFANYDSLRLYYLGMGGNGNSTTRFRRYPGTGERPMLPEHDLQGEEDMIKANTPVLITIESTDQGTRYWRNDELLIDFKDDQPLTEGWFGFRTVHNHMQIHWFKVEELKDEE